MRNNLIRTVTVVCIVFVHNMFTISCSKNDDTPAEAPRDEIAILEGTLCETAQYPDYQDSRFVLPYPVGKSYGVDLAACSSSYHAPGSPDQFAIDFAMSVGEVVTASESGRVVFVEESGVDYNFPNNKVIIASGGGYLQYMHLTFNGALVEVDQFVTKGDTIGISGATGLAGYPHLHLVHTMGEEYAYPYSSGPINFSNTKPNERGPETGQVYEAEPYD